MTGVKIFDSALLHPGRIDRKNRLSFTGSLKHDFRFSEIPVTKNQSEPKFEVSAEAGMYALRERRQHVNAMIKFRIRCC